MTWTTVLLVVVAWCLVSVVAGFAFVFYFGGMTRIHPDEIGGKHMRRSTRQDEEKSPTRSPHAA